MATNTFKSGTSTAKKRKIVASSEAEESREKGSTFDFTERTWKADFALIVENRKLFVAKIILALASPVFEKMFQSDFKEKDVDELELPGKKFDDMQDFLRCIYPGVMARVSAKNVYKVLSLAEEYQVSDLKCRCEQFLISSLKDLSIEEVYDMLKQASTYNMEDLLKKCIEMASEKPIENFDCALERMSLPFNVMNDIKDKMVRRLEPGVWYEGAYKFLLSGLKRADKLVIEKCKGWTGISLQFPLSVSEMKSSNTTQLKFILFDTEVMYSVRYAYSYITLEFSDGKDVLRGWTISLCGKLVLKCGTSKNEDFTDTFEMSFKSGNTVQSVNTYGSTGNASYISKETEGFIHNGKIDAEIHLLATRQKIQ